VVEIGWSKVKEVSCCNTQPTITIYSPTLANTLNWTLYINSTYVQNSSGLYTISISISCLQNLYNNTYLQNLFVCRIYMNISTYIYIYTIFICVSNELSLAHLSRLLHWPRILQQCMSYILVFQWPVQFFVH
jgi:hypothetical protein